MRHAGLDISAALALEGLSRLKAVERTWQGQALVVQTSRLLRLRSDRRRSPPARPHLMAARYGPKPSSSAARLASLVWWKTFSGLNPISVIPSGPTAKVRLERPGDPGSEEPGGLWRAGQWIIQTHIGRPGGRARRRRSEPPRAARDPSGRF
jgi:hypothetical protein